MLGSYQFDISLMDCYSNYYFSEESILCDTLHGTC
jgi:hypothetical protein